MVAGTGWQKGEGAAEYLRRTSNGKYDDAIASVRRLAHDFHPIEIAENTSLDDDRRYSQFRLWAKDYLKTHQAVENWQDPIEVPQEVHNLLEEVAKKVEAAGKEDSTNVFLCARDRNPWPWYQRPLDTKLTRNLMKGTPKMIRQRLKPRTASTIEEVFRKGGDYCYIKAIENVPEPVQPVLDICEILDMKPRLDPAEAQAISKALKHRVSRNKALGKKGDIDKDPIWEKWTTEDKTRLGKPAQRLASPIFPILQIGARIPAPTTYKGVRQVVSQVVPQICVEVHREYKPNSLDTEILGDAPNPMSMEVMAVMDQPSIYYAPGMRGRQHPINQTVVEQRPPMLSMIQMIEIDRQRVQDGQDGRNGACKPKPKNRLEVPRLSGMYDRSALEYHDFMVENTMREPLLERVRGVSKLLEQLDWESLYIEGPELYETTFTATDTDDHIMRYGPIDQSRIDAPRALRITNGPLPYFGPSDGCSPQSPSVDTHSTATKRMNESAEDGTIPQPSQPVRRARVNPQQDMDDLRKLVLTSEAKIDMKKKREIEPMANSRDLNNFLSGMERKQSTSVESDVAIRPIAGKTLKSANGKENGIKRKASLSEIVGPKGGKGKKAAKMQASMDWRKHQSIRNPSWYGKSIRLAASDTAKAGPRGTPVPIFIASNVLRNRPIYKAIENVNFDPAEETTLHIQYVDMVLTPSTGIIFYSLAKLHMTETAFLTRIKAAAIYFPTIIIVFEVIPYRTLTGKEGAMVNGTDDEDPLSPKVLHALASFQRAIAIQLGGKKAEGMIGTAEVIFATNGAEEVTNMLKGLAIGFDSDVAKTLKGKALEAWRVKKWVHGHIDPEEQVTLIEAGFNLFSTHLILAVCGSFSGFAEGMSQPERLKLFSPILGKQVVNRFNAKWWRRQVDIRDMQSSIPISDTATSPLAGR